MYSRLYTFHLKVKTIEGKEKYNVIIFKVSLSV